MKTIVLVLIKFYQIILSPFLNAFMKSGCRYSPSCSVYSYRAIEKFGFLKGSLMSAKRIISCNPMGQSGFDPVK